MKKFFANQLAIIIFTIFLDALGFGILIPIIPLLLADPGSTFYLLPKNVSVSSGYVLLGLITAVFPLTQLFSTSILGQFSDKFGRKPILMYTIFGTAIAYVMFAFGVSVKNIALLFLARSVAGIASGNVSVAQASIADVTEPKDRAKNFGLIGAAFGLGFILGPFIGGKLSDPNVLPFFSPAVPFYFAAILSFINAFSVRANFTETNKFIDQKPKVYWGRSIANIFKAFKLENLRFLYLTNFLFFSGFTFFVTFIGVYLIEKFHFTQGNIGDFFSFMGIWIVFTQAVVTRRIARYFDEKKVLKITIIADGIFIGFLYFASSWWMLYFIVPIIAMFNGLTFANMGGLISRSADQKIQGEILGINASVQALAQLVPPILSGFIAAVFTPETPLIVASVIVIFSGVLFASLYRPSKSPAHIKNY